MGQQQGREFLIKIGDGQDNETFATLCGLNSKRLGINNNEFDVTTMDCTDPGGPLWAAVLAGIKRITLSGNGYFEDSAAETTLLTLTMSADPRGNFQVIMPDFGTFQGNFLVQDVEYGGELEDGVTYSLTLGSNKAITFTPEA